MHSNNGCRLFNENVVIKIRVLYKYIFLMSVFYASFGVLHAGTITVEVPLDFGTVALVNNNAVYTLRVGQNGSISHDSEFVIITSGVPGRYFLSAFPANTLINVSVVTADPSGWTELAGFTDPSSTQFQVKNFDTIASLNTDANGEKTIYIGATLFTSGTGNYIDAQYVAFMDVIISY